MKKINFTKMVGAGNDFIMVDNRKKTLTKNLPTIAKTLCDRKLSVGADGLILLEKSKTSDVAMRIFNADGSEAEMCGNGVRCLALMAVNGKNTKKPLKIQTLAGPVFAQVKSEIVKVKLTDPKDMKMNIHLKINGIPLITHFINTGVPHAVTVVSDIEKVDVFNLGRTIRYHEQFAPKGTNANFMAFGNGNWISNRIYERGVENETLSSGTGSAAAALIAATLKGYSSPITVHTRTKEVLKIYFSKTGNTFFDVYMEGPVKTSFQGSVTI